MNYFLLVLAIITTMIISLFYLKEPLEEKDIEGTKSLVIRIVVGIVAGLLISVLLQM